MTGCNTNTVIPVHPAADAHVKNADFTAQNSNGAGIRNAYADACSMQDKVNATQDIY